MRTPAQISAVQNFALKILPYWVAAAITALISVLFARVFAWCEHVSFEWAGAHAWWAFLIIPAGLLISAGVAQIFSPYASGSGIPQLISAVEIGQPSPLLEKLIGFRIIFTKFIGACLCVAGGGVTGREGPMLQISAAVFYTVQKVWPVKNSKLNAQSMILAGGAAGLASAFNTPLGGVVFAIEELAKVHISNIRTVVFHSVIIAGLLAQGIMGNYLYIGKTTLEQGSFGSMWPLALASVLIGAVAAIFSRGLVSANDWRKKQTLPMKLVMTAACGLVVAGIFYLRGLDAIGSGREVIIDTLTSPETTFSPGLALARFFGNYFTYIGGVIGGVFAPALSTGAAIGGYLSQFVPDAVPKVWILAGMVSFLTGLTRTPFTSLILVLEMTDSHALILTLMLAGIFAQSGASLIDSTSFYENMSHRILKENGHAEHAAAAPA